MLRMIAIAAAAALVATTASAESIHISTRGKSTAQVQAEVAKAARQLCWRASFGATFPRQEEDACIARTIASALTQAPAQTLAQR